MTEDLSGGRYFEFEINLHSSICKDMKEKEKYLYFYIQGLESAYIRSLQCIDKNH